MLGALCWSHSPVHPQLLHTGNGCRVISQEAHRSSVHDRGNDEKQDRNPVQAYARSAGKSHGRARWRSEHSGQQGQVSKQWAQTWHTNMWGAGLWGPGSHFLLSPIPTERKSQDQARQRKRPSSEGQLKWHSAWQVSVWFWRWEPGLYCCHQSPAVPQLLSPCTTTKPWTVLGTGVLKLPSIPTPKMYKRSTTSPLFMNGMETLWHQCIKSLQWKTPEDHQ